MEAQSNKPHRKPKEKKKHTGGMFHHQSPIQIKALPFGAPCAGRLIDRFCLQTIPRPLRYTGLESSKHKLRDRRI